MYWGLCIKNKPLVYLDGNALSYIPTAVLDLWKQIVDAFAPWIQPLDNNGQVLSPWLDSDIVMATTMVGTFVEVLKTLYEKFEGTFFLMHILLCSLMTLLL